MSTSERNKISLRRRRGCAEDCIRRIAAHLCQLEHASHDIATAQACGSTGCCKNTSIEQPSDQGSTLSKTEGPSCADACCESLAEPSAPLEAVSVDQSGCCSSQSTQEDNADPCCASQNKGCSSRLPAEDTPKPACSSTIGYCSPKASPQEDDGVGCASKPKCCSPKNPREAVQATTCAPKDECCGTVINAGKTADCCKPSSPKGSSGSTYLECQDDCCYVSVEEVSEPSKPICSAHLTTALERYEAILQLGKCLCRTIQEQLGICCCAPASCKTKPVSKSLAPHGSKSESSACGSVSKQAKSEEAHCREQAPAKLMPGNSQVDIESEAALEHVVVGISGMTCTGCSRKMMNVLDHIPGVSAARVTFVTESAEFLLDPKQANVDVEQTIRRIERETGFKLTRVSTGDQELDILLPGISAEEYARHFPNRLVTIEKYDNKTFRVTYDPRAIGARSLLIPGTELAPHAIDPKRAGIQRRLRRTAMSFSSALVLTIPVVVLSWGNFDISRLTADIVSLILATLVQCISVPEFYIGAIKSLVYSRVIEMDMLVVISVSAAYLYSVIAFILELCGIPLEQGPFFETAVLLITLVLLGRLLSASARVRAVSAVALRGLQSRNAVLLLPNGNTKDIDARLLEFGDKFRVSPHSQIVTDGIVVGGQSAVDESMITGESIPVSKQPGDKVTAGTLNGPSGLECQLSRLPGENSISDIAGLVESAVEAKPKVQDLADKIASYFIPCVMGIALVVFAIWIGVAVGLRGQDGGGAVGTAITYAIAVLAVSCPCALGLAVPMVLVIAGGVAAKAGVVIKAALAVERGYQVTDVVFDKTGTLTMGDLQVVTERFLPCALGREGVIALVNSLVDGETHPVSIAVAGHFSNEETWHRSTLQSKSSKPGLGIEAQFDGTTAKAGSPYWLGVEGHQTVTEILHEGFTSFCVTIDGDLVLAVGLRSSLREESAQVVRNLRSRSIDCHIVSGDNPLVVEHVRRALDISPINTVARSSPAEKQQYVARLQLLGKKVIFVGDGTNDAVAIAQATVGMQVGAASDVTSAVADVVLLGGLNGVVQFLDVSKRAFRRIWFNFVWSAVYNLLAILLAAGAFVDVRVPPAYAGLGEIVSIGPVIVVALTLMMRTRW